LDTAVNVKVGPQFYKYGQGAMEMIPDILNEYGAKRVLIVHGTISWQKASPYLKFLDDDFTIRYEQYNGECSYNEGERLAKLVADSKADFIIGVGGGKLCDLVYYVASLTKKPFGVVPTLASNCAPWAPLSVMYKDNGLAEGKTEHYKRQTAFLITDPTLVIDAPINFFIAGIADTLAKWYESDMILEQPQFEDNNFLMLARHSARICKDVIAEDGIKAIEDMRKGIVSTEFIKVSEVIFGVAGLVGGFGDKYARNTAAHAIHDAISAYLPGVHNYLHGEKVAYGIFYQLALEGKWQVIDELIPMYETLHLPKSLTEMGEYPLSEDALNKIAALIDRKEKVHLLPITINEAVLKKAIIDLEKYINTEV
jgi:hydroxycarboxylate dehydrogenase A